jgi:nicotinate-nucleotide--dimethylbenzimidazole phosphoribosyltransferase
VTTKSEQSEAADERPVVGEEGHAGPAPEPNAHAFAHASDPVQPFQPLPSIIVDPAVMASSIPPAGAEATTPPPANAETSASVDAPSVDAKNAVSAAEGPSEAAPTGSPATETPQTVPASTEPPSAERSGQDGDAPPEAPRPAKRTNGVEGAELTDFEAERFASNYRASWEPGEALAAQVPEPLDETAPLAASAAALAGVTAAAEPLVLPGSARRRGLALTALAVIAFGALLALALSSATEPIAIPEPTSATNPVQAATAERADPAPAEAPPPPSEAPSAAGAIDTAEGAAGGGAGDLAEEVALAAAAAAAPPAEEPSALPPEAPTPVAAAAASPAEPEPAPKPAAIESVRIRIATVPPDAALAIDGSPVPNPYDELVPRSDKHRVVATAAGYETSDQLVGFDRKRDLVLRLARVRPARSVPEPEPTVRAARPRPTTPKVVKKPEPEAPRKGAAFVSESPY